MSDKLASRQKVLKMPSAKSTPCFTRHLLRLPVFNINNIPHFDRVAVHLKVSASCCQFPHFLLGSVAPSEFATPKALRATPNSLSFGDVGNMLRKSHTVNMAKRHVVVYVACKPDF